jgi:uncharacterized RDD family membrane protein YckC
MSEPGAPAAILTRGAPAATAPLVAPGLMRRMACFVYEGVLLFGLLMIVGLAYGIAVGQRNAMFGRHGLQAVLWVVLGVYFVWFWSHGGQTLAMKTWRIRLVGADGAPASVGRCTLRYLFAWAWFAPALFVLWLTGAAETWVISTGVGIGVFAYAAVTQLLPGRQFLHDLVSGSRLVTWPSKHAPPGP